MRLPDVRVLRRRARRLARWTGSIAYRTIVVPLLDREETEHAVDLACRLAADRCARIVLVAPAVLERDFEQVRFLILSGLPHAEIIKRSGVSSGTVSLLRKEIKSVTPLYRNSNSSVACRLRAGSFVRDPRYRTHG